MLLMLDDLVPEQLEDVSISLSHHSKTFDDGPDFFDSDVPLHSLEVQTLLDGGPEVDVFDADVAGDNDNVGEGFRVFPGEELDVLGDDGQVGVVEIIVHGETVVKESFEGCHDLDLCDASVGYLESVCQVSGALREGDEVCDLVVFFAGDSVEGGNWHHFESGAEGAVEGCGGGAGDRAVEVEGF